MAKRICSIEGCDSPHKGRGYCNKHLIRDRLHGSPYMRNGHTSVEEQFWSHVDKDGPIPAHRPDLGPCWVWTASLGTNGYGQFTPSTLRRNTRAYRWAYEHFIAPVADGLHLDHLCRNTTCVNFERHLEPVTPRENYLRSESGPAQNARKTHCLRGHELSGANVYERRDRVGRECRACHELRKARRLAK